MECCKSENTFIFAWTPERIRWAEVRRYAYTGGDKPVKPRRSADPEIAHAAQHGVPLYRVSYSGNAVYDPVSTAEWAEFHHISLPQARLMQVMMGFGREDYHDWALLGYARGRNELDLAWMNEWREREGKPPITLEDCPRSLADAWDWATGAAEKPKSAAFWRDLFQQQVAEMDKANAEIERVAGQRDRAMDLVTERVDRVMLAAGEYLLEDDERIAALEREIRKYRVVLQELGIDPDGIPDLPGE